MSLLPFSPGPTTRATTQAAGDNSTLIATDAFVTTAVNNALAGVNPAVAVQAATTANVSGYTYNNGASGVGATLVQNSAATVVIDGYTLLLNDRVLFKNQTAAPSGSTNGIYVITTLGTGLIPAVFTRATDYNQPSDINNTGAIPVVNGTVNGTTQWVLTSAVATIGTDALTYTEFTLNPSTLLLKANNLSDVANATTSFTNIKQNATSSVTGVIELNTDLGGTATAPTVPALANSVKIGSLIGINHSYGAGTTQTDSGTSNVYQESYFSKIQSILKVHEINTLNLGQAGSAISQKANSAGSAFGGWAGVAQYVLPSNTTNINAASDLVLYNPVVAVNGVACIVHGVNDFTQGFGTSANNTQSATNNNAAGKNAYRFVISRIRSGVVIGSSVVAGSITWDGSLGFSASWNNSVASVTQNSGPAYIYTSTSGETVTHTIPTTFTGGTIAVNFVGSSNGVTNLTGNVASSGGVTLAVAANSAFPQSGTVVVKIGSEEMLVTSGLGTNSWTVTAGNRGVNGTIAAAHSTNDVIAVATDTFKVNWSTNGSNANITGSTSLSGQGTNGGQVMVTTRFACTSADAGKTIVATAAGIITGDTSAQLQFDSVQYESSNPGPIICSNLHHWNYGEVLNTNYTFIANWNTMLTAVVAEFDSFVKIADVYTPYFNRNGSLQTTLNNTDATDTISWTCNSSSYTPTIGTVMSFGGFGGEHVLVTAVSGSAPNWTLNITRGFAQTLGGTTFGGSKGNHSIGAFLGPMDWMSVDDIHITTQGHAVYAETLYEGIVSITGLGTYQIAQNGGNWGQYSQSFQMGIVDNNWISPPIAGTAAGTVTQNRISSFPMYISKTCTIVGMATIPRASSTATMRYGIYLPDATHSRPGRLLQDFGAVTYTTQSVFIQTGIYQILRPGWYWFAAVNQSTAISMNIIAGSGLNWPALSSSSSPSGNGTQTIQGYTQASVSGALPDWSVYTEAGTGAGGALEILVQLRAVQFA